MQLVPQHSRIYKGLSMRTAAGSTQVQQMQQCMTLFITVNLLPKTADHLPNRVGAQTEPHHSYASHPFIGYIRFI